MRLENDPSERIKEANSEDVLLSTRTESPLQLPRNQRPAGTEYRAKSLFVKHVRSRGACSRSVFILQRPRRSIQLRLKRVKFVLAVWFDRRSSKEASTLARALKTTIPCKRYEHAPWT